MTPNNTHIEAKIQEFSKKVDLLSRKTGFGGNKKEKTDFGFKTEIDWDAVENWFRHAFTDLLDMQKKEIVVVLEGMKKPEQVAPPPTHVPLHRITRRNGYNSALDEAITRISEK